MPVFERQQRCSVRCSVRASQFGVLKDQAQSAKGRGSARTEAWARYDTVRQFLTTPLGLAVEGHVCQVGAHWLLPSRVPARSSHEPAVSAFTTLLHITGERIFFCAFGPIARRLGRGLGPGATVYLTVSTILLSYSVSPAYSTV